MGVATNFIGAISFTLTFTQIFYQTVLDIQNTPEIIKQAAQRHKAMLEVLEKIPSLARVMPIPSDSKWKRDSCCRPIASYVGPAGGRRLIRTPRPSEIEVQRERLSCKLRIQDMLMLRGCSERRGEDDAPTIFRHHGIGHQHGCLRGIYRGE